MSSRKTSLKFPMGNRFEVIGVISGFLRNYSALKVRIIIAWGNAPGAGVYDVIALSGRIKMGSQGAALGFNKAPFQG